MPFISSDPHAWMRPYYEAVAAREGFAQRAIPTQFAALVDAIAVDYPAKAAKLREIADLPSQRALLLSFSNVVYRSPVAREVELWRVAKDGRQLRCIAVYMPTGIDLRLMEGEDFRRTQLLRDGPALEARSGRVEAEAECEGLGVNAEALATLQSGRLHRFADWPNPDVPAVAIGLYTIWRGNEFIYVGLAGRTSEAVLLGAHAVGRACGLRDRLRSHASGRRSGDQFCVYVADRLVLPTLTRKEIESIARARAAFDTLVRDYIHQHLAYRFFALPDLSAGAQRQTRELERLIRRGETPMGLPLLPLPNASGPLDPPWPDFTARFALASAAVFRQ